VGPLARAQGKLLIVSFHDFQATPDLAALKNIVSQAEDAGADIVKVATLITGVDDVRQLAELLIGHQRKNLIVIGIGGEGVITRLLFPGLGSLVTFAYLGNLCTAPGQLPYPAMFEQLRQLYPAYYQEKSVGLRLPEKS
jgi:3-dehydroquinate dehydratase-1